MLESHEAFAQSVESLTEDLAQGVRFEQSAYRLTESGDFTNRYRVTFSSAEDIEFEINTKNIPSHLQRQLINNESVVCSINGGFFFLTDDKLDNPPKEIVLGTIVRDGVLCGVQSHDRPVLWVDTDGVLQVTEVISEGYVTIGNAMFSWVGNNSGQKNAEVKLFGVDSCVIQHVSDSETGTKRVLNEELSKTPAKTDIVDIVCEIREGCLVVSEKREGGGTSFLEGNFLLQGDKEALQNISVGDMVTINYNDLNVKEIRNAMTVGPSVFHFDAERDHPINHDRSLGDKPSFSDRRMARSVVYKTINDAVTFEVFDGAPKTATFQGVTPEEVADILKQNEVGLEWAYFLDPGQSARLAVRHADGSVEGYGNRHYVRWPSSSNQPYLWAGEHGRAVPSVVNAILKHKK
ncbi:phosphodiester glycosidase family protein [Candidatus Nomurabacteria bacterium]|nr:phosphodiester glycosidase family protein [Candidatus Nomurabacteria bacterium]